MANRPVFISRPEFGSLVETVSVEFEWAKGMALSQKIRSMKSLHDTALRIGVAENILEISTASETAFGKRLSAFNLTWPKMLGSSRPSLEAVFQSSKIFEGGGPFRDLLNVSPRDAKRDERLTTSGNLVAFDFDGERWELEPKTAFYDWIYINSIKDDHDTLEGLRAFDGFTDIMFNPQKSINCQARSAALCRSLYINGLLEEAMETRKNFLKFVASAAKEITPLSAQLSLF